MLLALVVLATASASLTVTRAAVAAPLRAAVSHRSAWLGKLFSCPWCMSHWVAAAIVAAATQWQGVVQYVVVVLAVTTLAAPTQWAIYECISRIPPVPIDAEDLHE